MIITIPILALVIYALARQIRKNEKSRGMTGMCVISIIFGIVLALHALFSGSSINRFYLICGILWIILGAGRILYDYMRSLK